MIYNIMVPLLNTNMKVNSNLSQHVSSSHEGSVAIPLEFPSRII